MNGLKQFGKQKTASQSQRNAHSIVCQFDRYGEFSRCSSSSQQSVVLAILKPVRHARDERTGRTKAFDELQRLLEVEMSVVRNHREEGVDYEQRDPGSDGGRRMGHSGRNSSRSGRRGGGSRGRSS